jgi:hypothetical protein
MRSETWPARVAAVARKIDEQIDEQIDEVARGETGGRRHPDADERPAGGAPGTAAVDGPPGSGRIMDADNA